MIEQIIISLGILLFISLLITLIYRKLWGMVFCLELILFVIAMFFRFKLIFSGGNVFLLKGLYFGILAGHLAFFLSILITTRSFNKAYKYGSSISSILSFYVFNKKITIRHLINAIFEESIWRATLQPLFLPLLGNSYLNIIIVSFFLPFYIYKG